MKAFVAFHRTTALLVSAFLILHICNHVVGLTGQQAHIAFMAAARHIYRIPLVEAGVLVLLGAQVASGIVLGYRRWKARDGVVAWLQMISGGYLAFFLLNHVAAVFYGRAVLGLDTDFRFAAAGFHVQPWAWFFAPYYGLALWALFTHLGCALHWRLEALAPRTRGSVLVAISLSGGVLGTLIVLSLAGALFDVDIPARYLATYR